MTHTQEILNKRQHTTNKLLPVFISAGRAVKTSGSSQSNSDSVAFSN